MGQAPGEGWIQNYEQDRKASITHGIYILRGEDRYYTGIYRNKYVMTNCAE